MRLLNLRGSVKSVGIGMDNLVTEIVLLNDYGTLVRWSNLEGIKRVKASSSDSPLDCDRELPRARDRLNHNIAVLYAASPELVEGAFEKRFDNGGVPAGVDDTDAQAAAIVFLSRGTFDGSHCNDDDNDARLCLGRVLVGGCVWRRYPDVVRVVGLKLTYQSRRQSYIRTRVIRGGVDPEASCSRASRTSGPGLGVRGCDVCCIGPEVAVGGADPPFLDPLARQVAHCRPQLQHP